MGEENKPGAVKGIELEKQGIEAHLLVKEMDPVTMTEMNTNRDKRVENENLIDNLDSHRIIPIHQWEVFFQLKAGKVVKRKRSSLILLWWEKSKS